MLIFTYNAVKTFLSCIITIINVLSTKSLEEISSNYLEKSIERKLI
jgi:hypothetical protein